MVIEKARGIFTLSLSFLFIMLFPSLPGPRADDSSETAATDRISSGLKEVATGLQTLDESLARRAANDLVSAAALSGHSEITELLIEHGADVNAKGILGITPLMCAAEKGDAAMVWVLIAAAKRNDQTAVIELLKKAGAVEPAPSAQRRGSLKVPNRSELQEMIASSDYNADLIDASLAGDTARVNLLLEGGADVKTKGLFGMTALMHAAQNGRAETSKALISWGADPNATNEFGMTPLMFAAKEGHADVVKVLIDSGADFNAQEQIAHQTALMLAERAGHAEIVEILKKAEAGEL